MTFRGPDDGDGVSPRNVVFFKYSDAVGSPRRLNQYDVTLLNFFTDFRTAYDTIKRQTACCYERFGFAGRLTRMVELTMKNSTFQSSFSALFGTTNLLRGGEALARLLFSVALEKVIRDAGIENRGTTVNCDADNGAANECCFGQEASSFKTFVTQSQVWVNMARIFLDLYREKFYGKYLARFLKTDIRGTEPLKCTSCVMNMI